MEDYSSEDDDDTSGLLKKALDVKLPKNFDPNITPQTGEEYIQHVMYERKQCKTWIRADVTTIKTPPKPSAFTTCHSTSLPKTPQKIIPPISWQLKQVEDFNLLRKFVEFQKKQVEGTVEFIHDTQWRDRVFKEVPKFSVLCTLSQNAKFKLIDMIGECMETEGKQELGFMWLYGLLACLELPLSPGNCYDLRKLAKSLADVRLRLAESEDENECIPVNLLICIIARVFNQIDLIDE